MSEPSHDRQGVDGAHSWTLGTVAKKLGFDGIEALSSAFGAINAHGYHQFVLRDGKKPRVISAPRPWLKAIQGRAYCSVLKPLPISASVYSRPGAGVVENARQHTSNAFLTILDVADCFPSTRAGMVRRALCAAGMPDAVGGVLTRLTTFHGVLPQGPPTSPAILNVVFAAIDDELRYLAIQYDAVYTRYMDDLAFSGNSPLTHLDQQALRVLKKHGYRSNPEKRRVWGPSDRHTITKIVLGSTLNPTPEFLAALTKHLVKLEKGEAGLSDDQIQGKIAWVTTLNPLLGKALELQRRNNVRSKWMRRAPAA